ncbi:site-specific integrase [Ruegeria atlantica]|uniref:site-specific integrase n=1 Tax=Ruegeria atlantica TaxID=81569 RepID=UPI002495866A|nr:site-specific integrase [Ruegeria atlantica]
MTFKPTTYHLIRSLPSPKMAGEHVPMLLVSAEDGTVIREAYEYLHDETCSAMSQSWRNQAVKTIGLFFDFFKAKGSPDLREPDKANSLVNEFLLAVYNGTVQPDGSDETGLNWSPASNKTYSMRKSHLKGFLGTLEDLTGNSSIHLSRFARSALSARAHEFAKERSLLYHLRRPGKSLEVVAKSSRASENTVKKAVPFPGSALVELITKGCRKSRSNPDFYDRSGNPTLASEFSLNTLLAVLLMAGAGLRKSELFHLFLQDVTPEGVYMYDPEQGWMDEQEKPRVEFLRDEFNLLPRNRVSGGFHAGFKSFLITDGKKERSKLHFLPQYEKLFFAVFSEYRRHVVPRNANHPYLFVSTDPENYGEPWTIGALNMAFQRAMNKAGIPSSKFDGTNIHGLRHSYGQSLVCMNLSPLIIQECMHHLSIESQNVYTRPSSSKINDELQRAAAIMEGREPPPVDSKTPDLIGFKYDSDPAGIFAPHSLGVMNDRL